MFIFTLWLENRYYGLVVDSVGVNRFADLTEFKHRISGQRLYSKSAQFSMYIKKQLILIIIYRMYFFCFSIFRVYPFLAICDFRISYFTVFYFPDFNWDLTFLLV